MIDTNVMALAQQLQDLKEGIAAAKALIHMLGGLGLGGVTLAGVLAYIFRHKFLNTAVVAQLESVAQVAVSRGQGMAEAMSETAQNPAPMHPPCPKCGRIHDAAQGCEGEPRP